MADEPEQIDIKTEINERLTQRPYAPFQIVMSSGREFEVPAADAVAVARNFIIVVRRGGVGYDLLRTSEINSIGVPDAVR